MFPPPHARDGHLARRTLPDGRDRRNYAGMPDVGAVPDLHADPEVVDRIAPDGRPWLKCCDECAFKDRCQVAPIEIAAAERNAAFYCVHRETVGGHYRVCAGFAARDAGRRRDPDTGEVWHERDDWVRARRAAEVVG